MLDNMSEELNTYWQSSAKVTKSGYISRNGQILESNDIAKFIYSECERRGIKIFYDLAADGCPDEISIAECFAGNGGIMLAPLCNDLADRMMKGISGSRDYSFLKQNEDKYCQFEGYSDSSHVIFLPGSNLLPCFAIEHVRKHMEADTLLKPHPITNSYLRSVLLSNFRGRVLAPRMSSAPLLRKARKITTTEYSEMGLYAKVRGQNVEIMRPTETRFLAAYRHLYRHFDELDRVLSTHLSGVFFPSDNYKQEVIEYFDHREACLKAIREEVRVKIEKASGPNKSGGIESWN